MPNSVPYVVEIGMATPDIVCVVARDQDIVNRGICALNSPDSGTLGALVQRDYAQALTGVSAAGTDWCHIVGQKNGVQKMYLNFGPQLPTNFLDRVAVDNPANWSSIGGKTVTAVYRKSKPYGQGQTYSTGLQFDLNTMEHHIFLKLSGNLAQGGPYTISVAGNTIPAQSFTFNDRSTRSISIRTVQTGHRAAEGAKQAQLQLWIPGYGTEGRVDFANTYGLTTAELIDSQGVTVFTGSLTLLIDATTVETGYQNYDYASSTTAPKVATAVTRANPCQITCAGHGFTNGQKIYLQNFGVNSSGSPMGIDGEHTVTVVDANNFTIGVDTTSKSAWLQGAYLSGFDSLIFTTWNGNRWGTLVYQLDFSAFDALTYGGDYRVRIPGLGVSDSFSLRENVRFEEARIHMKGYYNQLTGMALDASVGGWARPTAFQDGQNGVVLQESTCPSWFVSEAIFALATNDTVLASNAVSGGFATTNRVSNWGPTIRDAGDWDWHQNTSNEGNIPWTLLEFGYRQLPASKRDVSFGFPKASTLDPVLYAGTDGLGDQFHMAVFQADSFRKTQKGDGRVYGGMNYANGGGGGGGYSVTEPSYMSQYSGYLLAADPNGNTVYAGSAAKIAQVLLEAGFTSAGNSWKASAIAAWNWAESIYQDYLANGATGSVVDGYFNGTCNFQANAVAVGGTAYSNNTYFAAALATLFGSAYVGARVRAAGTLYSLTGDTTYGDIIAPHYGDGSSGDTGAGLWDFGHAANVATDYPTQAAYLAGRWTLGVTVTSSWPQIAMALFASTSDQTNTYAKFLQTLVNYGNGVNQENITQTTGLGNRFPQNASIRDREAMGLPTSQVPGTTVFFHFAGQPAYAGFFCYSSDSSVNFSVCSPTGASLWRERMITPYPIMRPFEEGFNDNTNAIFHTEFQTSSSSATRFTIANILHCFDGNNSVTAGISRVKRQLAAVA